MKQHTFGVAGARVAAVGQGTWRIDQSNRASVVAALRHGLDLGMNHIDTAEMYGSGVAEEIIAEAIAGRRDEVFLVSKVLPRNASSSGTVRACEKSLKRLKTDRIDCCLLHWRGSHPLDETIAAFERLQREGKIRSWGVSNFDVHDLDEAWKIGGGKVACNQVMYHLNQRAIEHAVIPWCEKHGVAVVGYTPFGHVSRWRGSGSGGARVLEEIAKSRGTATPRQIALAFLVRRESLFTIRKASSVEHCEENAGAGDIELSRQEMARIDEAFPLPPHQRELPME